MLTVTDNLAKRLHKGNFLHKYEKCKSGNEYATVKDSTFTFKCLDYNKNYQKGFHEGKTKKFKNTFQFCDWDINKICVICEKGFIHVLTWISGKKILSIITSKERILQ